jgi:hypothetical protein
MPSIEVTAAQAAALARGENVTLAPAKRRTYVLVSHGGNVWRVSTTKHIPLVNGNATHRASWLPHFKRSEGDEITLLAERVNGKGHTVPKPGLNWSHEGDGHVRVTEVKP